MGAHSAVLPGSAVDRGLRLHTLGKLRLEGAETAALSSRRKELVLLAYLARRAPRPVARAELAALLWEERDEGKARQSLRQALLELRRVVGDGLQVESEHAALAAQVLEWDVAEFEREVRAARFAEAVGRWGGEFLADQEQLGGEGFRGWLEAEREALRRQLGLALARLVEEAIAQGARTDAIRWAERWVELLPADERGFLQLLESLHLAGRPADALARYEAHVARLRTELQIEPPAVLLRVGERLQRAAAESGRRLGSAALFTPDLVGRDDAFEVLAAAWEEVRTGQPGAVVVHGESGIGKTRLCQDFLRWLEARSDRLVILRARAHEAEQTLPGKAARELFAGLPRAPGVPAAPEPALAACAELLPGLREQFPHLPAQPPDGLPLEDALRRLLEEVGAEVPVAALLDDAPMADERSRHLVLALLRHAPAGVLLLLTGRTEDWSRVLGTAELEALPAVRMLRLRRLARGEVEALVASALELGPLDRQELAGRLHAESRGNPFYAIELLRALVEEDRVAADHTGIWRLAPGLADRELPLPVSVRDVVARRLTRLTPPAREALEVAAVLGVPFDLQLLARVADLPMLRAEAALDELLLHRFVQESGAAAGRFEFAHELVRRQVDRSVPAARAEALSRRAVAALEARVGNGEAERAAIARHRARTTTRAAGRRRRLIWLAAGGAVALALGIALPVRTRPPSSASLPNTIAVLPFSVRASPELSYLGEGMAMLLGARLNGAGHLRSADARAVLGLIAQQGGSAPDATAAGRVAERVGAGIFLLGAVVQAGERLHLEASAYRHDQPSRPIAQASVEGSPGQLVELVDALASGLLPALSGGPDQLTRLAARTTASLRALRAYLEGERLFREGRFGAAAAAFGRAVAEDSAFALAHYRHSVASWWNDEPEATLQAAAHAVRHGARLADRERELLRAWEAFLRGDPVEAERLYSTLLGVEPENVEGWTQLGEVQFHSGPRRGHPISEAGEAFERVLSFEPEHLSALLHLARIAASTGRRAVLDSLTGRLLALDLEGAWALEARALHAFAVKDTAAQRRVVSDLEKATDGRVWNVANYVAGSAGDLGGAGRLVRLLADPIRGPDVRAFAHIALAHLALAEGRRREAALELERATALDSASGWAYRALLGLLPFAPAPDDELARIRAALERWRPATTAEAGPSHFVTLHEGLYPAIRAYLLGRLGLQVGDSASGIGHLEMLARTDPAPPTGSFARGAAASLRAEIARRAGRHTEALAELEEILRLDPRIGLMGASAFHSRAWERYLYAELLEAVGRREEALRRYDAFATAVLDLVYLAPSHLQRARIAERLGRPADAAAHYRRVAELWGASDPELRPVAEAARRRAVELQGASPVAR